MSTVLTKKQMTEEDIKLQYITPAIISKWDVRKITMETQVTDGKINLKGNFVFREKPKRADYILYMSANNPIAVIEAKDNKHYFTRFTTGYDVCANARSSICIQFQWRRICRT